VVAPVCMLVPPARLSAVGKQAFTVAGPHVSNTDGGDNDILVTFDLLTTSQNPALQKVIPGHDHLNQPIISNLLLTLK